MSRKNNKDKAKNRQGNASAKHYATIVAQRLRRIPKKVWWAMAFLVAVAYSWVFYSYFVEPSGFRWRALYGDPKYPDTDGLHGCDISHHQGVIDWEPIGDYNSMYEKSKMIAKRYHEKLRAPAPVPACPRSAEGARPMGRISQAKGQSVPPRKACISVFEALKNQRCSFFGKH